jgi:starch synthase
MPVIPSEIIKVLVTASEAEPFIKVGGLGDVAGSLPPALINYFKTTPGLPALDIRLIIPFHSRIQSSQFHFEKILTFPVAGAEGSIPADIYLCNDLTFPVYLVSGEPLPASVLYLTRNAVVEERNLPIFSRGD